MALLLAFWQRPWGIYSDTRIEMVTNPGLLLSRASQVWTSTIDLGHIQASQFVGYLFPMAPFYVAGDLLGIPPFVVQRLWIGLLLAIAAWGVVRLIEVLRPSTGRAALIIAGLLYISSPFVTVSVVNATIWLVPYALLPWMLLITHKALVNPKSWRAPALLALLVAASATAVTPLFWLLLAVALLAIFEAATWAGVRALLQFIWRAGLLSCLLSLWWIVPVVIQAKYGTDYLTFTEHPETILNTPSASESLRLLGFWPTYWGGTISSAPKIPSVISYLFSAPTIAATFLVPALAVVALAIMRTWRYASYFGLLLAFAVAAMSLGFPQDSAYGRLMTDLLYGSGALQFLRTTYKAAPLAALSISVLAGITVGTGLERLSQLKGGRPWLPPPKRAFRLGVVFVVGLVALWGRPLWFGNAMDSTSVFSAVPSAWTSALEQAQKVTPANTRIALIPGDQATSYTWARTEDSIAPGLSERPVLVRQSVRAASPQAAQLVESVDSLIQEGRLTPGQLRPLLQLMGVGRVLVGSDTSASYSATIDPARVAISLATQPGFKKPAATFGPKALFQSPFDRGAVSILLPQVRAYASPKPAYPGINRVHSITAPKIVDGDADGIVTLAGVGALNPRRASFYAADLNRSGLRKMLTSSPTLAFTDSNRRRGTLPAELSANTGYTLQENEVLDRRFPDYRPFGLTGAETRTVAVYSGLRALESPNGPGYGLFPEHRPFAALDGDVATSWITDEDDLARRYMQLRFAKPMAIKSLRIHPHVDQSGSTLRAYLSVDGSAEQTINMRRGWNNVPINSPRVTSLRVRVPGVSGMFGMNRAGIDELSIPGLRVNEALRLPTRLASLAAGQDLSKAAMEIAVDRGTADFPGRVGNPTGPPFALDPADMTDAEREIRRIATLPEGRRFSASGWGAVAPSTADSTIDQLAGVPSTNRYDSSGRFEGVPLNRASSAFDGDAATSWVAEYNTSRAPWIQWVGDRSVRFSRIRISFALGRYVTPTRVVVDTSSERFDLPVKRGGVVVLPRSVVTNKVRITPRRLRKFWQSAHNVRAIAVSSIQIPGVPVVRPRRSGRLESGCPAVRVSAGGQQISASLHGTFKDLDTGSPLRVLGCGAKRTLGLKRGSNLVIAKPGPIFTLDSLLLKAAAPVSSVTGGEAAATLASNGSVKLNGGGWLVLGQSYSRGWKAWCSGDAGVEHELGPPVQIDGYANGWPITGSTCRSARFEFAPQQYANVGYWISGLSVAALMLMALLGLVRDRLTRAARARSRDSHENLSRHRVGDTENKLAAAPPSGTGDRAPPEWSSLVVAVALYWIAFAAIVLIVLGYTVANNQAWPILYPSYPLDRSAGHWIAVVAILAVGAASLMNLIAQARRRPGRD